MNSDQQKWDRIYAERSPDTAQVSDVLYQNKHLLPQKGDALDLACGLGANALFLAEKGLNVTAWDISSVAISSLIQTAERKSISIQAEVRDVIVQPLPQEQFDVIIVSHFLAREMNAALIAALKPGGLLFYQTYCRQKDPDIGPKNTDYLLADNELLNLFSGLKVRIYREESMLGDTQVGWRNQAMLVAEKK